MNKIKKLVVGLLVAALAVGVTGCGSSKEKESTTAGAASADYSVENPVTVKIGLTGAIYEDIWNPIKEELSKEGIHLEYVQFSDFALPNEALHNGEIDLTAHQHHAYLNNQLKEKGWDDISAIGDTFIVAMNIYSDKIKDVSEIKDGDKVALPNDVSNEGRALKLLASAGLIVLDENAGVNPEVKDIKEYKKKIELVEVNASDAASVLPDVTIAVINGNYALDAGIDPEKQGIFFEKEYDDDSYFCLIAARKAEESSPVYAKIVKAFQSEGTKKIFLDEFKGYFKPAWEYKFEK